MSNSFDDIRAEVLPGSHLVARVPGIVIVIRRDGGPGRAAAAQLLALVRNAAADSGRAPGRELARTLTQWVVSTSSVPDFGTISATEDGIAVFLHGDVTVTELPPPAGRTAQSPTASPLRLSGRTAAFTVDQLLSWPAGPLLLAAGAKPEPDSDTAVGVLGWAGLIAGLVPGNGLVLGVPLTAAQAAAALPPSVTQEQARPERSDLASSVVRQPQPVAVQPERAHPEPAQPAPAPASALSAPAPPPPGAPPPDLRPPRVSEQIHGSHLHEARRPPLPIPGATPPDPSSPNPSSPNPSSPDAHRPDPHRPDPHDASPVSGRPSRQPPAGPVHVLVKGFRCSRNHHNDPRVSFCSVCGIRMDQRTGILVDGRRPPLGLLVLDIGSTFVLDDNYLLGRNPEVDEAVIRGRMRPIRLDDDSGTLSRVHAEIRLEGWDVLLIDRSSANGTFIAGAGQSGWTRLSPTSPQILSPGMHVRTGRRTFTFESAHARI